MPADHLLLKVDLGSIPMLERNPDPARDEIAAAAHPAGPLVADPDDVVEAREEHRALAPPSAGLFVPSLKPIRLRGVSPGGVRGRNPVCAQRICADAIGEAIQLAHRVKRDLRIIGAGLHRKIAAGARGLQLVAVEFGQVDQRLRPLGGKPVAVHAVLHEQPGPEAESERQPRRRQAQRRARRPAPSTAESSPSGRAVCPDVIRAAASVQSAQHRRHLVARLGEEVEGDEIAVRLLRGRDAALMRAKERLRRRGAGRGLWRSGARDFADARARQQSAGAGQEAAPGRAAPAARTDSSSCARTSVFDSSSTK